MKTYYRTTTGRLFKAILAGCALAFTLTSERAQATTIADSILDFSATQGSNDWYYGYYANPGNDLSLATFIELDGFIDNYWHHASVWFPPWTAMDNISLHPNGTNSPGIEEWAVRRWVSPETTTINLSGLIAKDDLGGNGVIARIVLDGTVIYTVPIDANDDVGVLFSLDTSISAGSFLDFVVDPDGDDLFDTTFFSVVITQIPEPSPATIGFLGLALMGFAHFLRFKRCD